MVSIVHMVSLNLNMVLAVRSKADETLFIVETLICPLQIYRLSSLNCAHGVTKF